MKREPLTYCSFASATTCLGVLILDGHLSGAAAAMKAHALKANPGGELLVVAVPDHIEERDYLRMFENRGRLLSLSEARELLEAKPIREWEEEGA